MPNAEARISARRIDRREGPGREDWTSNDEGQVRLPNRETSDHPFVHFFLFLVPFSRSAQSHAIHRGLVTSGATKRTRRSTKPDLVVPSNVGSDGRGFAQFFRHFNPGFSAGER